ncbi:uncharacterized protein KY384_001869 [Bacidia gigantensis]|uniref:uncharacterized protein n=1 Tax=Bacidia gigantensis TaxID=2732470 RepID=UPI001D0535C7|nr:uncharacterized protein KY384_001869 [Bacidia gigantensis]KAG8533086.1 hypothetical protein KY384_001869 [Bacidia gigantensis]
MTMLSNEDIKVLESIRQRLATLTSSLDSLRNQILISDPLPPWPSLHAQSQLLLTAFNGNSGMGGLLELLRNNSTLLRSTVAYPVPSYPGREQEALLNQILRKKLEPQVEEWAEDGETMGKELEGLEIIGGAGEGEEDSFKRFWRWAMIESSEIGMGYNWLGPEGEGPEAEESEDEEEDSSDEGQGKSEKMKGVVKTGAHGVVKGKDIEQDNHTPSLPMEQILRFLCKGEEPKE